jgi:hypothetical protein
MFFMKKENKKPGDPKAYKDVKRCEKLDFTYINENEVLINPAEIMLAFCREL